MTIPLFFNPRRGARVHDVVSPFGGGKSKAGTHFCEHVKAFSDLSFFRPKVTPRKLNERQEDLPRATYGIEKKNARLL